MGERAEDVQSVGIERIIPLRFMQIRLAASQPDCLDKARVADGVRTMNEVYRPAGVQFVPEFTSHVAPNLYWIDWFAASYQQNQSPIAQGSIGADIATVYPGCVAPTVPSWDLGRWASWASLACHPPASIPVWVPCNNYLAYSRSGGPNTGRAAFLTQLATYEPARMAHEIGHYFGLNHISDAAASFDSRTQAATGAAAAWEFYYKPGSSDASPHTFPASEVEAQAAAVLWPVLNCTDSPCTPQCANTTDGRIYCDLPGTGSYTRSYDHWSVALQRGLAFGGAVPPATGPWGANVMSYFNLSWPSGGGQEQPAGLSPSQIALVRRSLRYETTVAQNAQGSLPAEFLGLPGRRPSLGQHVHRPPAYDLDFDLDGRRDLAIYRPTNAGGGTALGRFIVRLSASGATFQILLGADPSAIPIVVDVDGDGRTDAVVYEVDAATGLGHFRWCPTPSSPTGTFDCGASPTLRDATGQTFAARGDVPFPFKGAGYAGTAFAVYRPSTCTFRVRANDGSGNTSTIAMSYSAPDSCTGTAEPIVDLFDGDAFSDVATYEPGSVKFRLKTSTTAWSQVVRTFPSYYVPSSGGSAYSRSGAVVVRGMADRPLVPLVGSGLRARRAAFALWQPEIAYMTTMFSPHSSSTMTTCTGAGTGLGIGRPMGGLGAKLHAESGGTNVQTKLAVLDPASQASSPDGLLKLMPPTCAAPSTVNLGYTPLGVTVEPIGDINGDDLPELLWVQATGPYAGIPFWFLSPGYTTYDSTWAEMAKPWDIWL